MQLACGPDLLRCEGRILVAFHNGIILCLFCIVSKLIMSIASRMRLVELGQRHNSGVLAKSVAAQLIHALRMQAKRGKLAIAGKDKGAIWIVWGL